MNKLVLAFSFYASAIITVYRVFELAVTAPLAHALFSARFRRAVLAFSFFASTLSIDERPSTDPLRHPAASPSTDRPTGPVNRLRRARIRSPAATSRAGTAASCGRSGSIRASAPPRSPTAATATCSSRAAPGCRSRSTCRPSAATTPTTRSSSEEVGRVGVAVDTLADAEILFDGIPLDKISTSFTINGTAAILLAFYVAAAEKKGVPREKLTRHHPERHPQGVRLARHLDLAAGAVAATDRRHHRVLRGRGAEVQRDLGGRRALPRRRRQRRSGDGVHARRRRHLLRHGRRARPDDDRRVRAADLLLLLHARRLLRGDRQVPRRPAALGHDRARTLRRHQRQGVDVPVRLRVPAARRCTRRRRRTTSCASPTRRWPSVLGGVQSMFTAAWDEPFALPSEESATLALRTQQILAYETGVAAGRRPARRLVLRRGADRRHRGEDHRDHGRPRDARRHGARASRTATCRA